MRILRLTLSVVAVLGASALLVSCSQGRLLNHLFPKTNVAKTVQKVQDTHTVRFQESYGKLPLSFIRNEGQVDERVKFYEKGSGRATFFTKEGVYLRLTRSMEQRENATLDSSVISPPVGAVSMRDRGETTSEFVKMSFLNANPTPEILAGDVQEGAVNYIIGNDPGKWRTGIPAYQSVVYKEIYPGIDVKFYGNNRQMEYDVVVKPGADPSKVQLAYEGIENLRVANDGDLEITVKEKKINQRKPVAYQKIDGKQVDVAAVFKVHSQAESANTFVYGFEVASYDKNQLLIIDPVLVYSTYLGGNDRDEAFGIAVDGAGNAYVVGATVSLDFPAVNPVQGAFGGGAFPVGSGDVFVAKLNTAGSMLVYSTYLGGSNGDYGHGIAVDASGSAYLTGVTYSSDFPTANPLQAVLGGSGDGFVAKLSASGSVLVYSTYLGGGGYDDGSQIATDVSGNACVAGWTISGNFPTVNPFQGLPGGGSDAFVAKLNAVGSALIYSTYLGGGDADSSTAVAVDASGNCYVTGSTASSNFPTANALQSTYGGGFSDSFVAKLSTTGSTLVYSTYLGGSGDDYGTDIDVDADSVYAVGHTSSPNFPTANALQATVGGSFDSFASKFNPAGSILVYSTYLGGSGPEFNPSIGVDASGNAYVAGYTSSSDFPIANAPQPVLAGSSDIFLAKLNMTGSALIYSSYLGGASSGDIAQSVAVDTSNNLYVTGYAYGTDFPMVNPFQGTFGGASEAFVAKIGSSTTSADLSVTIADSPDPVLSGQNLTYTIIVTNNGPMVATGVIVRDNLPSGVTYVSATPSQGTCSLTNGRVSCAVGSLGVGASSTVIIVVTPAGVGIVTNTASVSGNEGDPDGSNNISTTTTTVNPAPSGSDLWLTKTDAPDPVQRNATLTYTLTVTNNGPSAATTATVTDTLPSGVTILSMVSSQGSCSASALVVTCPLGGLANGASATVTIFVRINSSGSKTNTASVAGSPSDPNFSNNTATTTTTVVNEVADLAVIKTDSPDPVTVNTSMTYSMVVTNNGPSRADGVTLTDPLPPGVTFVSASSSRGSCSEAGGTVTCTIGRLREGRSATVTIVVTPTATGTLTNTATVSAAEGDPVPGNNSATATTTVNAPTINTPAGSNVAVDVGSGIALTFSTVSTSGSTTLTMVTSGPPPPTSFRLGNLNVYYDLNTTATFSGPITICFNYDDSQFSRENRLRLYHHTGSNWQNVTTTLDTTTNVICGTTTSLSPFIVAEPDLADLANISTRARVQIADDVMIGGFIVGGSMPKTVLIRARGASLGGAPFNNPGVLLDPMIRLYSGQTVIAQNDNWQTPDPLCLAPAEDCGGMPEITATGLDPCQPNPGQTVPPPGCAQESAIYVTLPPGTYTAIVRGVNNTSGMGLIEVFDVDTTPAILLNISTRARVETGDNVMIGGFIVGTGEPKTVLIRARGGSLGGAPFNNPGVLANPRVQLFSGQTVIAQNDDWQSTDPLCLAPAAGCGDMQDIIDTGLDPCQPNPGQTVSPPGCAQESAMYVTLPPGTYTAIVRGVNNTMGMGLVEAFEVSP